jgi:hypothetical protein
MNVHRCASSFCRVLFLTGILAPILVAPRTFGAEVKEVSARDAVHLVDGYRGYVVMLYLYASFDQASNFQFPIMNQLPGALSKQGFVLLALSVDLDPQALDQFLEKNKPATTPMRIVEFERGETIRYLQAVGGDYKQKLPYAAIFDRSGRFVKDWSGMVTMQEYGAVLDPLLAQPMPAGMNPGVSSKPVPGLNFALSAIGSFRFSKKESNLCILTKQTASGKLKGDESTFMAGSSYADHLITDKKAFVAERLRTTGGVTKLSLGEVKDITIDEVGGLEVVAEATDSDTQAPLIIYQVILFDDNRYYVMQGFTTPGQKEEDLKAFRDMARSFKRQRL